MERVEKLIRSYVKRKGIVSKRDLEKYLEKRGVDRYDIRRSISDVSVSMSPPYNASLRFAPEISININEFCRDGCESSLDEIRYVFSG